MVFECKWMTGFRCSVKAEVAGEVMQRLESEGRLTPANLVDEARPEESPMHKAFEWDDAKAAENYRRQQATQMMSSVSRMWSKAEVRRSVSRCSISLRREGLMRVSGPFSWMRRSPALCWTRRRRN